MDKIIYKNPTIVNLTPHKVGLYRKSECEEIRKGNYVSLTLKNGAVPVKVFEPSGKVARAAEEREVKFSLQFGEDIFNVSSKVYSNPVDLPDPQPGTFYLVSALTA